MLGRMTLSLLQTRLDYTTLVAWNRVLALLGRTVGFPIRSINESGQAHGGAGIGIAVRGYAEGSTFPFW